MRRPVLALLGLIALLAPTASTATPRATTFAFKVRLTATLVEYRSFDVGVDQGSCEGRLTGGSSSQYELHSFAPSMVTVRRGRDGGAEFVHATLPRLVGVGSAGGAGSEPDCGGPPGSIAVIDCAVGIGKVRNAWTSLVDGGRNAVSLRSVRPRLTADLGCPRRRPAGVPQVDLSLAKGTVSDQRLFDPSARVVDAVGAFATTRPVQLVNGTATVEQRVSWRLTFTRVQ